MRLDQRLRALRPDLSWARVREAIVRGQVSVDAAVVRDAGALVETTQAVAFDASRPALRHARLDLPRLYEDAEVLVVDKPAGLLSVPTERAATDEDTVLSRAQTYARHLHGRSAYAGVLHRLDRDTTGAMAVALSRAAHRRGRALFGAHLFERWYLALVQGVPKWREGTIDGHISNRYLNGRRRVVRRAHEGRYAVTHYRVREAYAGAALVELELDTGRQHQIRLHLQSIGHPLLGERVYGAPDLPNDCSVPRQMLHAWRLRFPHPISAQPIAVEAPVPADLALRCARLRRGK